MKIEVITSDTVFTVAEELHKDGDARVSIQFPDVDICPHYAVPIYALIDNYRSAGGDIEVVLPDNSKIERALTGQAGCIFGRVCRFANMDEYLAIYSEVEKEVLKLPNIGNGFKLAFGWCISEIMDNVIQHADAKAGYIMIQYLPEERLLKTCVFDLGRGIFDSLRGSKFSPANAQEALRLSVEPNVTSGNGQGNGLYGLREIVKQSKKGRLQISSGGAKYVLTSEVQSSAEISETRQYQGISGSTLVDFQVVIDDTLSIDRVFDDALPSTDLWLEDHEIDGETVAVRVLEIVPSTISREYGREMRHAVENIINNDHKRVVIDFSGVEMCSSAFVDELVGKLLVQYQFVNFVRMVQFRSLGGLSALLINHSIKQRMSGEDSAAYEVKDSFGSPMHGPTGPLPSAQSNQLPEVGKVVESSVIVEAI